jgi:hypothetical protein
MICPRCKRSVRPWILHRTDVCSSESWVYCIRQYEDVAADIARREAKAAAGRQV